MSELRFDFRVTRSGTTKLAISGTVEPHRCRILRDGVEMATALRAKGPVVIDLAGVDRLAGAALLILRGAADQAARHGRKFSVRNLRQEVLSDTRGVRLHRALWPDPISGYEPLCPGDQDAARPRSSERRSADAWRGAESSRSSASPAASARTRSRATSSSLARRGRNQ